ncbi:MAG TPA: hypothetical protein VGI60_13560 [Chthoniobacterales bacterium]|jgi:hypothetical protein
MNSPALKLTLLTVSLIAPLAIHAQSDARATVSSARHSPTTTHKLTPSQMAGMRPMDDVIWYNGDRDFVDGLLNGA